MKFYLTSADACQNVDMDEDYLENFKSKYYKSILSVDGVKTSITKSPSIEGYYNVIADIDGLEPLMELSKKVKQQLIIDTDYWLYDENPVYPVLTIYDYYIE